MRKFFCSVLIFVLLLFIIFVPTAYAQSGNEEEFTGQPVREETLEGKVVKVIDQKEIVPEGGTSQQLYQKLKVTVTKGTLKGKDIEIENGNLPETYLQKYSVGDQLVIIVGKDLDGKDVFFITDYVRRKPLFLLFVIFIAIAVLIGKLRGFTSLIGMALSFLVIFKIILPQISSGKDPITVSILASMLIVPITFYLSHGVNKKTTVAIVGTIISLTVTGILANVFVNLTKLTGFSSEEAGYLQSFYPGTINVKGLLLAGIIIGGLGIFDDITISQSAVIYSLKNTLSKATFKDLYFRGMEVGHDHIASMINTLILVYTSAALPLLLLFIGSQKSFSEVINYEFMAEEIVRTLVASIGLILAVPITTLLASYVYSRKK